MNRQEAIRKAPQLPPDGIVRTEALRLYVDLVRDLGGDPARLLGDVRIDPDALSSADAVISYRSMIHLLERTAADLNCPDFGLRLAGRQGGMAVLGPLEVAMRNASTVGEAYRFCAAHLQVYSPVIQIGIEPSRGSGRHFMRFEILLERVPNQRQTVENALGLTHHAVLALSGGRFGSRETWFTHEPLAPAAVYRRFFGGPVRFGQPYNAIFFDDRDLDHPIGGQNPRLSEMASCYIASRYPARQQTFVATVRTLATRLLPHGTCTHDTIAAQMGMHPRTLQRRLRDEGTSFDEIKDQVRRAAAERYLRESDLPLTKIAMLLGYSETSVLTRSCQRWFSASPRQVRKSRAALRDSA
ncbi:MAG: AraC family transcriptional regulator [Gammaproteobacteria bacterium]